MSILPEEEHDDEREGEYGLKEAYEAEEKQDIQALAFLQGKSVLGFCEEATNEQFGVEYPMEGLEPRHVELLVVFVAADGKTRNWLVG